MKTAFSTQVSTQHKPAFASLEMGITCTVVFLLSFFPTSPYSQGLILTPKSNFDSHRPSGTFSDLDPYLLNTPPVLSRLLRQL